MRRRLLPLAFSNSQEGTLQRSARPRQLLSPQWSSACFEERYKGENFIPGIRYHTYVVYIFFHSLFSPQITHAIHDAGAGAVLIIQYRVHTNEYRVYPVL